jgi:hypothetical protein
MSVQLHVPAAYSGQVAPSAPWIREWRSQMWDRRTGEGKCLSQWAIETQFCSHTTHNTVAIPSDLPPLRLMTERAEINRKGIWGVQCVTTPMCNNSQFEIPPWSFVYYFISNKGRWTKSKAWMEPNSTCSVHNSKELQFCYWWKGERATDSYPKGQALNMEEHNTGDSRPIA